MERNKLESLPDDLKALAQELIDKKFPEDKPKLEKVPDYSVGIDYGMGDYYKSSYYAENIIPVHMNRIMIEVYGIYSGRILDRLEVAFQEGENPQGPLEKLLDYAYRRSGEPVLMMGRHKEYYFSIDSKDRRVKLLSQDEYRKGPQIRRESFMGYQY